MVMDFINVAMEEYKTLREEINTAMSNQQSILNYGIASMSVIIAFSSSNWQEKLVIDLILILLVPVICLAISTIWLGEVNRVARAGNFLVEKEREINRLMKDVAPKSSDGAPTDALMWENYLRYIKKNPSNKAIKTLWNYRAILVLLFTFGLGSITMGMYHNFVISKNLVFYLFLTVALFFVFAMGYSFMLLSRIKSNHIHVVIDGGGSKTRIYINSINSQKTIEMDQGLNFKKNSLINHTFKEVFTKIDESISLSKVNRFTFGFAGLDQRTDRKVYKRYLEKYLPVKKTKFMNDGLLIAKVLRRIEPRYVLVMCGTGSNVLSSKRRGVIFNHDLKCDSKAGAIDMVTYFIDHYNEAMAIPSEMKAKVNRYKHTSYLKNDINVIKDFTELARLIVSNMDNAYCYQVCEASLDTLIECIKRHDTLKKKHYKLFVFGGLFNSEPFFNLFKKKIEGSNLKHYNIEMLKHDFVRRIS